MTSTLLLVTLLAIVAVGIAAVWLTNDARLFGVVILAAGVTATGLVGSFRWRTKLRRRILADAEDYRRAA
jgi:uncharacterized membrane protein YedE/YeeE